MLGDARPRGRGDDAGARGDVHGPDAIAPRAHDVHHAVRGAIHLDSPVPHRVCQSKHLVSRLTLRNRSATGGRPFL